MNVGKKGVLWITMDGIINAFPGYTFENGHNMYRGVDVTTGGYVYGVPGIYEDVALLDSASHHPTSAIMMDAFGEYTQRFKELLDARIFIKHGDFDSARKLMNGELTPFLDDPTMADDLAQALKIAINSMYGLSSAKFPNPFHHPLNKNNFIACRGALFMKTLQDEVSDRGFTVVSIRTDSIKIANATDEIIQFVFDFGKKYGYTFEHEATYDRMCLVNDAVYIAKYDEHGIRNKCGKHAGDWTATGAQFQQGYVFKKLFSHEEIDFNDICEVKEVKSGALYLDMNEGYPDVSAAEKELEKLLKKNPDDISRKEELEAEIATGHNYIFVGRIGQFCPIKEGCGGGELLVLRDGKYVSAAGAKGYRWLESEVVRLLSKEADIDMRYYHDLVDKAIESISQYGDFEAFVGETEYIPQS